MFAFYLALLMLWFSHPSNQSIHIQFQKICRDWRSSFLQKRRNGVNYFWGSKS